MTLTSEQVQEMVVERARELGFNTPYGVLTSEGTSKNGKKYKSVTFGRPRTLDCEVQIYNKNFIVVRSSRGYDNEVMKSVDELFSYMESL